MKNFFAAMGITFRESPDRSGVSPDLARILPTAREAHLMAIDFVK
jgi:hypothetical protein